MKYAVIEDALVIRSDDDGLSFSYPAGDAGNIKKAVDYLTEYCKEKECPLVFYNVTPEMFAQLESWYPGRFSVEYDRDIADYVYESGKACHTGRKETSRKAQSYQ